MSWHELPQFTVTPPSTGNQMQHKSRMCRRCNTRLIANRRRFCSSECRELHLAMFGTEKHARELNFDEDSRFDPEDLLYGDYQSGTQPYQEYLAGRTSVRKLRARAHARFVATYRR